MKREEKIWCFVLGGLLMMIYGSFLLHRINLVTADLGRHIINGREVMHDFRGVFSTNYYSYTQPDFPVINHHWGTGLLFYSIWHASGFVGLHIFFIIISLATFGIMFWIGSVRAGPGLAALVSILVIPLLAERTEIRPEALSYLFAAIFLFLLLHMKSGGSLRRIFIALPLIEILWVNTHIFFFLGPVIVGVFVINAAVEHGVFSRGAKQMYALLGIVSAVALFNPAFIRGAIAPFTIFQNYGYAIAENKSVWFVQQFIHNPNFVIIKIVAGIAVATILSRMIIPALHGSPDRHGHSRVYLTADILFILGFGVMALFQTRNFALFGFFALPMISANIAHTFLLSDERIKRGLSRSACCIGMIFFLILIAGAIQPSFPYWHESGLGLETNNMSAAEFLRAANIKGPIFNDYDIGGYLIFSLFPRERVFVDNRPEAYAASFFTDTYIPLQDSEEAWRNAQARYGFHAIVFSSTDMTPWAQKFLIARIQDAQWIPVFADRSVIVFVKNEKMNQDIITRYAIPKNRFQVISQ